MSQDIINNRFLEESVFAIADGYCVINLTKSIVRGSMYQVVNGKKYNLNEQLGLGLLFLHILSLIFCCINFL